MKQLMTTAMTVITLAASSLLVSGATFSPSDFSRPAMKVLPVTKSSRSVLLDDARSQVRTMTNTPALREDDYITPPWFEDFDDGTYDGFTIINVNGDVYRWEIDRMAHTYMAVSTVLGGGDDWLITPPIYMEKGKAYSFSMEAFSGMDYYGMLIPGDGPETVEVKCGNANTVAAMTTTVIEQTEVLKRVTLSGWVVPEEDGPMFIGIHCLTPTSQFWLNVDDLQVSVAVEATRPGAVTDLTATPDPDGRREVEISFNAPVKDMSGDELTTEITKIDIIRGVNTVVGTVDNPVRGQRYTFTDKNVPLGDRTYTVIPYNKNGAGTESVVDVFVGPRVPSTPVNVKLDETENFGEVVVSWDPVTSDDEGHDIKQSLVTYNVYRINRDNTFDFEGETSDTHFTYEASMFQQDYVRCAVSAVTAAGESKEAISPLIIAGPPYRAPFAESFAGGSSTHIFSAASLGGNAEWSFMDESGGVPSQDGDNGFMVMLSDDGASAELVSGKINLAGLKYPTLTFHTYNISRYAPEYPDNNELEVFVRTPGSEFKSLKHVVMDDLGEIEGWYMVSVDLSEYKDQVVSIRFVGTGHGMTYTLLDNISIDEPIAYDLNVKNFSVPSRIKTGKDLEIALVVENLGRLDSGDYQVEIVQDGMVVATAQGETLESGAVRTHRFSYSVSPFSGDEIELYALLSYDEDEDPLNNSSETVNVEVVHSNLPQIRALEVSGSSNGVALKWNAPNMSEDVNEFITDTFEDFEPWVVPTAEGWISYDVDKGYIPGINGLDLPNVNGDPMGWFVFDNEGQDPVYFAAHSGKRYLAQLFAVDGPNSLNPVVCDDWIVSPALGGDDQEISFWAKSMYGELHESFEILYSLETSDINDFYVMASIEEAPANWTEYKVTLPPGANYFAIRCTSYYCMMLQVDDVNYIRRLTPETMNLIGYNIYCDGNKINDVLCASTDYTVASADGKDHRYAVTAVYRYGESEPVSGSADIESVGMDSAVSIEGGKGVITVSGATDDTVSVFTTDGRKVAETVCNDCATINVAPGLYIVHTSDSVAKVVVK